MKIFSLCFIFLLFSGFFSVINYPINSNIELNENQTVFITTMQNATIIYPSWANGQFINTYSQYGQLLLLPYKDAGSWVSQIYSFNTIYIYSWVTICIAAIEITLTVYLNYENTGWVPNSVPLNYTMNSFLNGDWEFFIVFNLTKLIDIPTLYNFTLIYFDDIIPEPPPFYLTPPFYIIMVMMIILGILTLIYLKKERFI